MCCFGSRLALWSNGLSLRAVLWKLKDSFPLTPFWLKFPVISATPQFNHKNDEFVHEATSLC
jgi:hypothetical protein